MFTGTYALLMAEYNRWMNGKLYAGCATLSDNDRKRDRGAFSSRFTGPSITSSGVTAPG